MKYKKYFFLLSLFLFNTNTSIGIMNNKSDEDFLKKSEQCTKYFDYYEKKYDIPVRILQSISLVESGRWDSNSKQVVPWPWTVNQGGRGYFFETKKDAVKEVEKMIQQGITNIDVGCMQVNLGYHSISFDSLSHAFEPKYNIEYGAFLLKNHYLKLLSWKNAIAAYHSLDNGRDYYHKVRKMHQKNIFATSKSFRKKKKNDVEYYHNTPKMNPLKSSNKLIYFGYN